MEKKYYHEDGGVSYFNDSTSQFKRLVKSIKGKFIIENVENFFFFLFFTASILSGLLAFGMICHMAETMHAAIGDWLFLIATSLGCFSFYLTGHFKEIKSQIMKFIFKK